VSLPTISLFRDNAGASCYGRALARGVMLIKTRTVISIERMLRSFEDRMWGIEDRLRLSHVSVAQGGSSRHGERY
jgi:hypothetical protein